MLEQVVRKLRHRKLARGFCEIDRAICADVEIVQTAKLHAVRFFRQHLDLARLAYRQQPLDRIRYDQISFAIEDHSEWTTVRAGKDTRLCAISLEDHDPAVFEPSVDLSFEVECDVLRLVPVTD